MGAEQARRDADAALRLAEARATLGDEKAREGWLATSADCYRRSELYTRLACYAEECARTSEWSSDWPTAPGWYWFYGWRSDAVKMVGDGARLTITTADEGSDAIW